MIETAFDAKKWQNDHPEIDTVSAGFIDISGIWRGKRLPIGQLGKIMKGEMKLPFSAAGLDIWGADPASSELVYGAGDADAICLPINNNVLKRDWLKKPGAFVPLSLFHDDLTPFMADPRHVLEDVLKKLAAKNLFPQAAFELEFYVVDPSKMPLEPIDPETGPINFGFENVLSLRELDALQPIFDDIYSACDDCNVEVDTLISESGQGQFEVNFKHKKDLLAAADEVVIFKTILRDVFNKYDMDVSFMAKTFPEEAGSGMHLHFSMLDQKGVNLFDDGGDQGTEIMKHAVAGVIKTMPDLQLIFAPHLNSYRRFTAQSHAPTHLAWAYDNRMVAVRIPASSPSNRRIEHRVAGSDANPYLVLAAVLGGAHLGIENQWQPSAPLQSLDELEEATSLALSWDHAIRKFNASEHNKTIFPAIFLELMRDIKISEMNRFKSQISTFEYQTYMGL